MGKRRRNPRMILPGAVGFAKVRYCHNHDVEVKPVRLFGSKNMRFHCKEGCDLNKNQTVLKQKAETKRRR